VIVLNTLRLSFASEEEILGVLILKELAGNARKSAFFAIAEIRFKCAQGEESGR